MRNKQKLVTNVKDRFKTIKDLLGKKTYNKYIDEILDRYVDYRVKLNSKLMPDEGDLNDDDWSIESLQELIRDLDNVIKNIKWELQYHVDEKEGAELGRFLFADERSNLDFDYIEADENIEKRLYDALHAHYHGNKPLTRSQRTLLKKLVQQGKYKKYLTPSPGKVYRGIAISPIAFKNMFGFDPIAVERKVRRSTTLIPKDRSAGRHSEKNVVTMTKKIDTIIPVKRFGSWSYDKSIALKLGASAPMINAAMQGKNTSNKRILVLLEASINDNKGSFVGSYKELPYIVNAYDYIKEKEVIQVDDVKLSRITWVSMTVVNEY